MQICCYEFIGPASPAYSCLSPQKSVPENLEKSDQYTQEAKGHPEGQRYREPSEPQKHSALDLMAKDSEIMKL